MLNFRISEETHGELRAHLFPGDGKEAVSVLLCSIHLQEDFELITAHTIVNVPYDECERDEQFVNWKTDVLNECFEIAEKNGWCIFKAHSHPTGYPKFSETDNRSDHSIFETVYSYLDGESLRHGSLVMLPDGGMFGRVVTPELTFNPIDKISYVGSSLKFWGENHMIADQDKEFLKRNQQAFGSETISKLGSMRIGIVGCSGTGSPMIEQLIRLGVGELVILDPEIIENVNLNRIIQATVDDAKQARKKVDVISDHYKSVGLPTKIISFDKNVYDSIEVINALISCDLLIGTVDSAEGRHLLNRISTFYLLPFLDTGVELDCDENGDISSIVGNINYILPGESLIERGVYTVKELEAEGMKRNSPEMYQEQRKSGYVKNVDVTSPAVIALNMHTTSKAVMDLLARIHEKGFRYEPNERFKTTSINLCEWDVVVSSDSGESKFLRQFIGKGDVLPLLNITELSKFLCQES